MKKKKFIITIDVEGDNLWNYKLGQEITTQNTKYLPRFQELCNEYGYKPVYLTNYEMINDTNYVDFVAKEVQRGNCEVGMHLHAWNTPPNYELQRGTMQNGLPYLIEYPENVMREKVAVMTELIYDRIGQKPVSHRAGRWAMNQKYFDILIEEGYKIDCSVTPYINWKSSKGYTNGSIGSDYSKEHLIPQRISHSSDHGDILEVPMTIYKKIFPHLYSGEGMKSVIKTGITVINKRIIWLRPQMDNLMEMKRVIDINKESASDYLMFMIHSSELMPGGSPYFKNVDEVEVLYKMLEIIFKQISEDYEGTMLYQYEHVYSRDK